MATKKAKLLSSKTEFKGNVFSVQREHIVEPDGLDATRDIVVHSGSVVLLPVFPDGSILLVRQYRHAAATYLWELVAGRIDPGESAMAGARRELAEETGYTATKLRKLLEIIPSPGFLTERMWIFLATGLNEGVARPEADERITSKRFSLTALEKMIGTGSIRDAKTISAVLFYARFVK